MALLVSASPPARAQRQDSVSRVGAALARLHPYDCIRVHSQQGWAEGVVERSSSSPVILRVDKTSSRVSATAIDSIFVGHSHAGKGALIGAAVTGILMAKLAGDLGANPFEGLGLGAVPGALLGAIVGSTSHHWSLAAP